MKKPRLDITAICIAGIFYIIVCGAMSTGYKAEPFSWWHPAVALVTVLGLIGYDAWKRGE